MVDVWFYWVKESKQIYGDLLFWGRYRPDAVAVAVARQEAITSSLFFNLRPAAAAAFLAAFACVFLQATGAVPLLMLHNK